MARHNPVCPKCGTAKKAAEFFTFSRQGGNADGRSYQCRQCEGDRQHRKRKAVKPAQGDQEGGERQKVTVR